MKLTSGQGWMEARISEWWGKGEDGEAWSLEGALKGGSFWREVTSLRKFMFAYFLVWFVAAVSGSTLSVLGTRHVYFCLLLLSLDQCEGFGLEQRVEEGGGEVPWAQFCSCAVV